MKEQIRSLHPQIKTDLSLDDFYAMERMERDCYSEAHITPAAEAMRWWQRLPESTLAAEDAAGICGFVNLFPVDEQVLGLLRAGRCNDRDLSADALSSLPKQGACVHLFLSCIVVREALRGTGFAYALLDAAMRQYDAFSADVLITDNATAAGARLSARLGLLPVCKTDYGTVVHEGDYAAARETVRRLAKQSVR